MKPAAEPCQECADMASEIASLRLEIASLRLEMRDALALVGKPARTTGAHPDAYPRKAPAATARKDSAPANIDDVPRSVLLAECARASVDLRTVQKLLDGIPVARLAARERAQRVIDILGLTAGVTVPAEYFHKEPRPGTQRAQVLAWIRQQPDAKCTLADAASHLGKPTRVVSSVLSTMAMDKYLRLVGPGIYQAVKP